MMKKFLILTFSALFIISCSKDDDDTINNEPTGNYVNGIFVTNEGFFNNGSGTVTFISDDNTTVEQDIYKAVNNLDLGNIVQSMGFQDDMGYVVVNNSDRIAVVNRYTFEAAGTIETGLGNPRYFVAKDDNQGYVSNWGDANDETDDYIAVIDLATNTVSGTIPVSFGPEKVVVKDNKLYVAHQGGFGQNNLVSVINTSTNTLEKTIQVGDVPSSMVASGNSLFVMCSGSPSYTGNETAGSLVVIDMNSGAVSQTLAFGAEQHPSEMSKDGDNLYYTLDGKVYKSSISNPNITSNSIFDGAFYTAVAHNGFFYGTDAKDYASDGSIKVFDLSTNTMVNEFTTGIVPGGIFFND